VTGRGLLKRGGVALLGLALALGAAELVLRLVNPFGISYHAEQRRFADPVSGPLVEVTAPLGASRVTTRRLKPNYEGDFGFPMRTNALGLRGGPVTREKPAGTLRVLCVGDSVTFGLGVEEPQIFVSLLAQRLNEKVGGGRRVEVINAAVPGWDGKDELLYLRDEGMQLAPDLVLLVFIPNDIPDLTTPEEEAQRRADAGLLGQIFLTPRSLERLYLFDFAKHLYWLRLQRHGDLERLARVRNFEQNPLALEAYRQILAMMAEVVRTGGARLVVVDTLGRKYMRRFASELGLEYLTILPGVGATPPEYRLSEVDAHPNPACHAFIAGKIMDQLKWP